MDVKITHAISRESFLKALSEEKLLMSPDERGGIETADKSKKEIETTSKPKEKIKTTGKPKFLGYSYYGKKGILEVYCKEYSVHNAKERNVEYCNIKIECINGADKTVKTIRIAAISIEQEAIYEEFLAFVLEELMKLEQVNNNDRILISTQNKQLSTVNWSKSQLIDNLSRKLCDAILLRCAKDDFKLPEEFPIFRIED